MGKLRLPVLAKPSFWGVFFLLWLLLRWLSNGKRSLSLPQCLDNRCMAGCMDLGLFHPSGHTYTSPCSPGQQRPSRGLFCLIQHIPAVPSPPLSLAALQGSCCRLHPSLSAGTWSWACSPPPLAAFGEVRAAALFLQLHHGLLQHHCCTVKHLTDLFIFSSRSCFLA